MLTWRLWGILRTPPIAHPLFQYTVETLAQETRYLIWFSPFSFISLLLYILLGAWFVPLIALPLLFSPLPGFLVMVWVFTGTFYGIVWLLMISRTLVRNIGYGVYDLISLSPSGALSAVIAVTTGCLYRSRAFRLINAQRSRILHLMLIMPVLSLVLMTLAMMGSNREFIQMAFVIITTSIAGAAVFRVDHMQSIVLGILIGMTLPMFRKRGFNTAVGVGLFLTVQLISYSILLLLMFVALPYWLRIVGLDGWYTDTLVLLLSVSVFYCLREGIIRLFWMALLRELDADKADLKLLQRFVRYTDGLLY